MVDVIFELTTNDPWSVDDAIFVKALVRWATGKRLTNRLPNLSLTTLSPPSEQRGPWSSYGPYVPSPKFLTISGDPGGVIYQILHEGIHFSLKSVFMVDVRFELTSNDPWSCRRRHLLGH